MRIAFDTSVLVAGLVGQHPSHDRSICWLEAAASDRFDGECSWHAVAETWSVLTRLPIEPAIGPPIANLAIERLLQRIAPIEVSGEHYWLALRRCAESGLRSGALFDALHMVSAESRNAECLLTFNQRDFERMAQEGGPRIVVPPDPPEVRL